MDWTSLYRQHCLAQALTECRMGVNGFDDLIGSKFAAHCYRVLTDQICSVWPYNVRSENFIVPANDNLGESFSFTYCDSFADSSPGEALDTSFRIFLFSLCLGQADKSNFWEGVDGVWHHIVIHFSFMSLGIISRDFTFHRCNVSQSCSMNKITDSIDTGKVRLHFFIDANTSPVVIQSLFHQMVQTTGISCTANCYHHIFTAEALLALF